MTKQSYLLILLFAPLFCFSEQLQIEHIGIEHGLSSSYIMSMTQDKNGYMWFATEMGLNRFDGNNVRVYKKNSQHPTQIAGNELNKAIADYDGNFVWIASQRDGLSRFDCTMETFKNFFFSIDNPAGIGGNDITDIKMANDGNLWMSFYYEGVDYYDKTTGVFTHYNTKTVPGLVSNSIWSIAEDNRHNLYLGHVGNGVSVISTIDKKVTNYMHETGNPNSLPSNTVRVVFIDKQNNVWLGTDNGLAYFNYQKGKFVCFRHDPDNPESLAANRILSIAQINENSLWIGTENGGISILELQQSLFVSPSTVKFTNIFYSDTGMGISNNTVRSIYQDSFKNIWIGTFGGGIDFVGQQPPYFKRWNYSPVQGVKNSLTSKVAWGTCVDKNNQVWVGTDGGGINVFKDNQRIKHYSKENSGITDNAILCALCDSENNLWFGTFSGGVNKYNSKTKTFSEIELPDKKAIDIRCLYEDDKQNIWIGSNRGIFIYNLYTKKITPVNWSNSALSEDQIRCITKDSSGHIWVGTFGNGISIFPPDNFTEAKYFNYSSGLPSNTIHHVFCDSKHRIWISTGEGLVKFNAGEYQNFSVYNEGNGIAGSTVYAIAESPQNELWISTNSGISHFLVDQNKMENFNHHDGIPMGIFMSGSVAKDKEGTIYFGGQNGVCYFNPQDKLQEYLVTPPVITEFVKYTKRNDFNGDYTIVPVSDNISLSYKENTFEIGFNVLDYSLNKKVQFEFRLKGLDDTWHSAFPEKQVTYRNIPPGDYTFELKARIKNQEWFKKITSTHIEIVPPIWWNNYSKLLYMILALFVVTFIVYLITRNIEKELHLKNSLLLERKDHQRKEELNNEKLKFFANMTHELKTPLTLIIGPIEDMLNDPALPFQLSKKIALIHKSSTKLFEMVNHILDFRKTEEQKRNLTVLKDDLSVAIEEIVDNFKELNTQQSIEISARKEEEQDFTLYFDPQIVFSIMSNLLSNALKNTKAGKIQVMMRKLNENGVEYTEIEVSDTGIGISKENLDKIFERYYQIESNIQNTGTGIGLAFVKNLVTLHQGRLFVESRLGEGTSFRFQLISNNTYPGTANSVLPEIVQKEESEQQSVTDKASKKVILVVEDNLDIQNYIFDSLNGQFEVITASGGNIGFEMASSQMPDIIISDVLMPGMNGFELCQALKQNVVTSHIPIILLTAKDTLQDKLEGYKAGADSYLTKPFTTALLISRINNILESRDKLATLLASYTVQKKIEIEQSLNKLDNDFIENITRIIEGDLSSESIGVEFIAREMNMSHSTLYRKIKALLGISVNEFIRKVKIRHAEKLLITGKYSVSEVSYLVGINSLTYFGKCFKDEYGVSPSNYLKKIKEQS